ncbi:MAG: DUF1524 domain-containing protein [Gordonia sp. (in: high G+C Gram-positive bacteria)]
MKVRQVGRFSPAGSRWGASAAVALAAVLIAGCSSSDAPSASPSAAAQLGDMSWSSTEVETTASPSPTTTPVGSNSERATAALLELDSLAVKGRAPKTGYDRSLFGQKWSDDVSVAGGHNGCDTRNDILDRDLTDVTYKPGTRNCVVLTGTLNDPYTGKSIPFQRGSGTSSAVQIDHVVAMSDAWQKGAQQLSSVDRLNFANDPRNLQATDGPTNQRKSDGDAATWLPPNRSYRCTYVSRQIEVKAAYRLWVTAAEKAAMQRVLSSGSGENPATTEASTTDETPTTTETTPPPTTAYVPPPRPRETTTPPPARAPLVERPAPGGDVYYQNCSAARAAGAAPISAGEPGYSRKLDRDGDGIACE